MFAKGTLGFRRRFSIPEVEAHCDGPCGVYDPASARIAAEAVLSLTRKLKELDHPERGSKEAHDGFLNTAARYIAVKEEQAEIAKREILVLWTDYFGREHLEEHPGLHDLVWRAAKLCSACKHEVSVARCEDLLAAVKEIHEIFWRTKNRDVPWILAAG
jgi:nickel superoxide dismutase